MNEWRGLPYTVERSVTRKETTVCVHCGTRVVTYLRPVTHGMAAILFVKAQAQPYDMFHWDNTARRLGVKDREPDKCRNFGLVERVHPDELKRRGRYDASKPARGQGYWKLTPFGRAFCRGVATIPRYAIVRQKRVLRYEGPFVTIFQCFAKGFDWLEICP